MSKQHNKNMKQKSRGTESSQLETVKPIVLAIPLFIAIAIIPILVGTHIDRVAPDVQKFWIKDTFVAFFDYQSAVMTMIVAVMMLAIMFLMLKKDMLPKENTKKLVLALALIYSILTIVSTVFARSRSLALWGAPDRYEGIFVHLSYMIILLYCIIMIRNYDVKKYVYYAIIFVSSIIAVLGISQMLGKDLLFDSPLSNFINMWSESKLKASVEGRDVRGFLSLTFGNPNYVGSYAALIIPMLLAMVFDKDSKRPLRISALLLTIVSLGVLFVSKSQAGIVGVAFALMVLFILNMKVLFSNKKKFVVSLLIPIIVMLSIFAVLSPQKKDLITDIFADASQLFAKENVAYDPYYGLPMYTFEKDGKDMIVDTIDGRLKLQSDKNQGLVFFDDKGDSVPVTYYVKDDVFLLDEPFDKIAYRLIDKDSDKQGVLLEYVGANNILLVSDAKEGIFLVNSRFYKIELVHAPHWGFEGKEKIGSGRGYIWSRSIPMLKDTIIKGYGPDNFLITFPQNDYWAKTYTYNNSQMITDKPHNMYLQWGIHNGVLALLSLLVVFSIYLFRSGRELFRWDQSDSDRVFKIGLICAVAGYLATGMFNDSVTSIAPIFWTLLGIGIAMMDVDQKVG